MKRSVALAGVAVLLAAGVATAANTSTTVLVTRGASMEPAYGSGDLALLQPRASYQVGDVAGYRSETLDRVVLHRIAAIDGDVLTFQGDANSFADPEPVSKSAVVGEAALRVPKLGAVLLWLASPVNTLLLTGLVALAVALSRRRVAPQRGGLEHDRVVAIDDLAFPHELPITDVAELGDLLRLAERHDRPVLHDTQRGLLFVVEGAMLFRHRVGLPAPRLQMIPMPAEKSQGRRPSPRGRGWDYDRTGS